jgi:23S rRNA (adenine2030-N6)-methyltransferase
MKYHHSFHAGNFADVHKHITLVALLDAMLRKDKGCLYLDTHAGAGLYELSSSTGGAKAPEWRDGIGRIASVKAQAPEIRRYLELVAHFGPDANPLSYYPGSPLLAHPPPESKSNASMATALCARSFHRPKGAG